MVVERVVAAGCPPVARGGMWGALEHARGHTSSSSALRAIALTACAAVVALTVVADATSGQVPTHSLVLMMAAATIVGMRLWSTRTARGCMLLPLTAGVLLQPVMHALAKMSHDATVGTVVTGPHSELLGLSTAAGQLLTAAAVALTTTLGEQIAAGLVVALWTCWQLLVVHVPVPQQPRLRPGAPTWRPVARLCIRTALSYRGPPAICPV